MLIIIKIIIVIIIMSGEKLFVRSISFAEIIFFVNRYYARSVFYELRTTTSFYIMKIIFIIVELVGFSKGATSRI